MSNENLTLINPSYGALDQRVNFSLQYNGHTGVKKVINSVHSQVVFAVNDTQKSRLGLIVQNHNEGKFIQNSNVQLLFNYNILKNTKHQLIVGGLLGITNLNIKSNGFTSQGSSWAPMNNVGLLFIHKSKLHIGLSIANLVRSELSPIKESFEMERELMGSLHKELELDLKHKLQPNYILFASSNSIHHIFSLKYTYMDKFSSSLGLKDTSFIWNVGLQDVKAGKGYLKLCFGSVLLSKSALNSNKYEIILSYYFQ